MNLSTSLQLDSNQPQSQHIAVTMLEPYPANIKLTDHNIKLTK